MKVISGAEEASVWPLSAAAMVEESSEAVVATLSGISISWVEAVTWSEVLLGNERTIRRDGSKTDWLRMNAGGFDRATTLK